MLKFAWGAVKTILLHDPINARLWLTYRCNYRCGMCGIRDLPPTREMDLSDLAVVASNLRRIRVSQVILTGGEPTLRADLVEVIRLFSRRGFIVRLQTNAGPQVSQDLIERCYAAGLQDISISLDTLDAARQDRICQADGVVHHALRLIRYCLERHGKRGIVAVNVTISAENFFELPALIEYIHSLGAFFNPCIVTRAFTNPSAQSNRRCLETFSFARLDRTKVEEVFAKLRRLIRKDYRMLMTSRELEDFRRYILTGDCRWRCCAGILSFDILPSGEFIPCCDTADSGPVAPVAHLAREDFLSVYRSTAFKEKLAQKRNACSGCLYSCYRDPAYLVRDPFVQLQALYKILRFRKLLT